MCQEDAQGSQYWPALHLGLWRRNHFFSVVSPLPISWPKAIGAGLLTSLSALALWVGMGLDRAYVIAGLAAGVAVVFLGRYYWRLWPPLMIMDHQRKEITLKGGPNRIPLSMVNHLELSFFAIDYRGYSEISLSLVLLPEQWKMRAFVVNRNNYDHDSFLFHGTSPEKDMEALALALAKGTGLTLQVTRQVTSFWSDPK
ncbi:MAG: hypothetical protein JW384_00295 [Nitrosomonadaceae bacterium]|nr:hypothetical protein [Nitrosomonadaceae bacterium]